MTVRIAVLKETARGEARVALDPATAERLGKLGASIVLQAGAGRSSHFEDDEYAGAEVVKDAGKALADADVLLGVLPPSVEHLHKLKRGALVVAHLQPHADADRVKALRDAHLSSLAMELIPRITRAQSMDALSSQATVAGYQAALIAAELCPRFFPMLTTAAGTIRPSKVVVIGAGVAGLQAIATARRLGAQVEAYDIRPAAREQVESLGARMIDTGVSAEGSGGYARELTEDERQQQADALARHLAKAHAVISTAAIPGRPAPKIISKDMVEGMMGGSVIVDLAAETGGNCELTKPGKTVKHQGKTIFGPLNLASTTPVHATEMYARNIYNLLSLVLQDGELTLNLEDEVIAGALLTHDGAITHDATRQQIEGGA